MVLCIKHVSNLIINNIYHYVLLLNYSEQGAKIQIEQECHEMFRNYTK